MARRSSCRSTNRFIDDWAFTAPDAHYHMRTPLWPRGRQNIWIHYRAGYVLPVDKDDGSALDVTGNLPAERTAVCCDVTKQVLDALGQVRGGAASETIHGYAYSLSPDARNVMDKAIWANSQTLSPHKAYL